MKKRRLLPAYVKTMNIDEPSTSERRKLSKAFRKGGVEFEPEIAPKMGDMGKTWGTSIDLQSKKFLQWTYVGDHWWARKRSGKYEFGKVVARENKPNTVKLDIVGLWDDRRHKHDPDPVIVYRESQKGYIVGHNEYELLVQWEDEYGIRSMPKAFSKIGELKFEYEQDYKHFNKLFKRKTNNASNKG